MITLSTLKNSHRPKKKVQRVGRGVGSKRGKTCTRGVKGDKARSGYKTRPGYEGGQKPLYRKLPTRGFGNGRFRTEFLIINLDQIDQLFHEGETVNLKSLHEKKYASRTSPKALKILGNGELNKKITIEAHQFSKTAKEKLDKKSISFKEINS